MSQTPEIPKTYDHRAVEARIYEEWESSGAFEADPNPDKQPFCIVIPPPNVTGELHMGHALNGAIQDTLTRRARMKGFEALWLPGTDHASIALQNVVERKLLREEGKSRWDLGRKEFLKRCWEFALDARSKILGQLRRLGASVDWRRLRFTMDERYMDAVLTAFVDLYDAGLIYRGNRITNWCPHDRSAISDLEVNYEEVNGKLYGLRYPFTNGKALDGASYVQVFTTRPETMLGDVALVVNPEDERYKDLVGKKARVPFVGREIEIFADEYVDPSFGTGILKVTPAHDPNDFVIGEKLGLEPVNVMNPDGSINGNGGPFVGMSREAARTAVVGRLEEEGLLGEVREYLHRVGHCDRCGTTIEPWLSEQWWVSMKELAGPAIEALKAGEITVYPDSWRRETIRWLENIQDWNVSRQLWWGQRIPVWYGPDGEVRASKESPGAGWEQDQDVLDTWFSSALWPHATLGWPEETEELEYFYPTSLLSTAREIMYLWVARMIMTGLRYREAVPFEKVNVHSIVLAADGTKMSKSKGNVVNPLDLFDEYGTDAVRFGLLYQSSTQDFAYSHERAAMGRGFVTKLWNATRFILSYPGAGEGGEMSPSDRWILSEFNRTVRDYDAFLEECEFSEAMRLIYNFAWGQFADWYIEIAKSAPSPETPRIIRDVFSGTLKLLHPVMPFATEEMWRLLDGDKMLATREFPEFDPAAEDEESQKLLQRTQQAVTAVRRFRADSNIEGSLEGRVPDGVDRGVFCSLAGIEPVESLNGSAATLPAGDVAVEVSLSEEQLRDEIERLRKEIGRVGKEVERARKKALQREVRRARPRKRGRRRARETQDQHPDARHPHPPVKRISLGAVLRTLHSFANVCEELDRRCHITLGLEHISTLLFLLGHPERDLRNVQVVGTNGKGTTAVALTAAIEGAGCPTGTYLSPHLLSYTERVMVRGRYVSEAVFAAAMGEVIELSDRHGVGASQFELLTAGAIKIFCDAGLGWAVLEAGLGARYDATTAAESEAVVLTNVGIDHTGYLGSSVEEIAAEKLASVPAGGTLVLGTRDPAVVEIARNKCDKIGARLVEAEEPAPSESSLPAYQNRNVRLGLRAAEVLLGRKMEFGAAEQARRSVRNILPGRFEVHELRGVPVIVDGGHNPDGLGAALEAVREKYARSPIGVMFGVLQDKDIRSMLNALKNEASLLVLTRPASGRAAEPGWVAGYYEPLDKRGRKARVVPDVGEALDEAVEKMKQENGVVLITGSLYTCAPVLERLREG